MSITLEKLEAVWNSRDKENVPTALIGISAQCKALSIMLSSFPPPETYEDVLAISVTVFTAALHFGYEIAKAEKLEELIDV